MHADLVEKHLHERGVAWLRFSADIYPRGSTIEARLDEGVLSGSIRVGDRSVDVRRISGVWWHSIPTPTIAADAHDTYRSWLRSELTSAIETVCSALAVPIFPDPDAVNRAGRKWRQLRVASELGFRVPNSVLTSDPSSLAAFMNGGPTVFKTLSHPEIADADGTSRRMYTALLDDEDRERAYYLSTSVGFFQRFVKKTRDVRVTVVGREVFAVAIESQRSERTSVDWRRYDIPRTPHEVIALSKADSQRCLAFLDWFGLEFGAFDFAEDEDGYLWFLELNPNGLWAWLELLTAVPISRAVAGRLAALSAK